MKQILILTTFVALAAIFTTLPSCTKTEPAPPVSVEQGISQEVKAQINALGFSAEEAYATDGGYIVEGDIFLSTEDLNMVSPIQSLIVGNEEQYRTTNLVTGLPRTITVRVATTLPASVLNATIAAIARYNAQSLRVKFSRVTAGGQIVISKAPAAATYIAQAGFPSGGNPYNSILFNTTYAGWNANTITTIIAHEMGHCIGFRHTDYMNRSYSCGTGGSEGAGASGAIHIPGTPTGPDPNSWMLACIGNGVNRPFNANDKVALNYVY